MIRPLTAEALEPEILQADAPVVLDFYQANCAPGHALEPRLERVAEAYQDRVTVYRVDVDRDMPIAERFGVMSLPTVLIFKGDKEAIRLDGLISESDLRAAFEQVAL